MTPPPRCPEVLGGRTFGTQYDGIDYGDLRVDGLQAEVRRRGGPSNGTRPGLLAELRVRIEQSDYVAATQGAGEEATFVPSAARRSRTVGCQVDLRDFERSRVEFLHAECARRGLVLGRFRAGSLMAVQRDVAAREFSVACD